MILAPAIAHATITPPPGLATVLTAPPVYQEPYLPGGGGTFISDSPILGRTPLAAWVGSVFGGAIKPSDLPAPDATYTLRAPDSASFHTRLDRIPAPGSLTVILAGAIGVMVARKRRRGKLLARAWRPGNTGDEAARRRLR
ncbi:MAG: hypothetical protein JO122_17515 [Acetobacteraceae bacterium]|nr:hypothetical protein [Acetobacteraceae bacterium]